MTTVMMSLWRNDEQRDIEKRMYHLLSKDAARFVWVVGDSEDNTEAILRNMAREAVAEIDVIRCDTGIVGNDSDTRLLRLSLTANAGFDSVRETDTYWVIHESDLISPSDIVTQLVYTAAGNAAAGWITLGQSNIFYDTFLYRKDGVRFGNYYPYHECVLFDCPFKVDSAGSVLAFPASVLRNGARCKDAALLDICSAIYDMGYSILVNPTIKIVQPYELWESQVPSEK